MSEPTFATRWHFLWADVLVALDPEQGRLLSQQGEDGPLLCLWTDEAAAQAALPAGYRLLVTPVRPRLAELPAGVGMVVDPGTDAATVVAPAYAADLKRYVEPFPAGARLTVKQWPDLPRGSQGALREATQRYAFVERVWALIYSVDDSPWIGLLVYDTESGQEGQESIADALVAALQDTTTTHDLGVLGVQVSSVNDLPPELRQELDTQAVLAGR